MRKTFYQFIIGMTVVVAAVLFTACQDVNNDRDDGPEKEVVQQVAPITATPDADDGPFGAGTKVKLSTTTEGAVIYYTTDGISDPADDENDDRIEYEGSIPINEETTIIAVARKQGMKDSEVFEATYTLDSNRAATPIATPEAGAVEAGTEVTLSVTTEWAEIYYTIDGSDPGEDNGNRLEYREGDKIRITGRLTIRAVAERFGLTPSAELRAEYTLAVGGGGGQPTSSIAFSGADFGVEFDKEAWTGQGEAEENWTLNVTDRGLPNFAVYIQADKAITIDGTDKDKVVPGPRLGTGYENFELALFSVKTGDRLFDGEGDPLEFILDVGTEGVVPNKVNITVNVTTQKSGAAVFKLLEKVDDVEYLDRLDFKTPSTNLVEAFTWVEKNAEDNTEYTIRVEQDEEDVPHLVVGLNDANNATLRLKGDSDGPYDTGGLFRYRWPDEI